MIVSWHDVLQYLTGINVVAVMYIIQHSCHECCASVTGAAGPMPKVVEAVPSHVADPLGSTWMYPTVVNAPQKEAVRFFWPGWSSSTTSTVYHAARCIPGTDSRNLPLEK
jgi:competence transcription factor ComK